jgi:hypothetical protein
VEEEADRMSETKAIRYLLAALVERLGGTVHIPLGDFTDMDEGRLVTTHDPTRGPCGTYTLRYEPPSPGRVELCRGAGEDGHACREAVDRGYYCPKHRPPGAAQPCDDCGEMVEGAALCSACAEITRASRGR